MAQILLKIFAFVVISAQLTLSEEFTCPRTRGYYPHPKECNQYYSCRKRISTLKLCPERMLFDIEKGNCYVDSAVDCGERKKPTVIVVTMGEIQTGTISEVNWNSDIVTETTNKLSTPGSTLSTKDDNDVTSDALRTADTEVHEKDNTATTEANVSDEILTTLSGNESISKENTLDGTYSTIFQTSGVTTDAVEENLTNNVTENIDIKTYSPFVSINEITDEDVTDITKLGNATVIPTEIDYVTTNENPKTGVAELNDSVTTDLFTSKIDNSSTAITTLEYINSNMTETFEGSTSTVVPYQTKSTYEDTVYEYSTENSLKNTSMDLNETTTKEEPSIPDLINANSTTYMPDVTTGERGDQNKTVDEMSTQVSSETGLSHDEMITTVTEYFDPITAQSNMTSDSNFVSDGVGKNNTSSNEVVDSTTQVTRNSDFETNQSTTQVTRNSVFETTEQNPLVTEEQYPDDDDYLNDLECPTAYGRYPHPTDKHKFFHCQEWFPHIMVCPANLIFDARLETCVWSWKYYW